MEKYTCIAVVGVPTNDLISWAGRGDILKEMSSALDKIQIALSPLFKDLPLHNRLLSTVVLRLYNAFCIAVVGVPTNDLISWAGRGDILKEMSSALDKIQIALSPLFKDLPLHNRLLSTVVLRLYNAFIIQNL